MLAINKHRNAIVHISTKTKRDEDCTSLPLHTPLSSVDFPACFVAVVSFPCHCISLRAISCATLGALASARWLYHLPSLYSARCNVSLLTAVIIATLTLLIRQRMPLRKNYLLDDYSTAWNSEKPQRWTFYIWTIICDLCWALAPAGEDQLQ